MCAVHALKPRLGLAPLYALIGVVLAFSFLVANKHDGQWRLSTAVYYSSPANVASVIFHPLLHASMVLVYVLEGTKAARRLAAAVVLMYVFHFLVQLALYSHASHPPAGMPVLTDSPLVAYTLANRPASVLAFILDVVVILVSYQYLVNHLRNVPLAIPVFTALVLTMVLDGIIYNTLRGRAFGDLWILQKLQVGIAAGLPLSAYLSWQLSQHKDEIRHGILRRDPLGILKRQVREIQAELTAQREKLQQLKNTFGRYVSNEVVQALLEDPRKLELGGELRHVTILFADIRGYSTLAEALAPTEVIGLLNDYFKGVTRVILENKGMINEFEGDAVLAVFGAPLELENHAELAVNSALGMLDAVRDLNAVWEDDGTAARWRGAGVDGLAIRIGIHTGEVVAGNIGSEARTKYAVIGDTVNTASRVEGLNKTLQTSVLLTSTTRAAVLARSTVVPPLVDMGSHVVKGRTEPVRVFTIENAYPSGSNEATA